MSEVKRLSKVCKSLHRAEGSSQKGLARPNLLLMEKNLCEI